MNFIECDHPRYGQSKYCSNEWEKDKEIKAVGELYDDSKRTKCKQLEEEVHKNLHLEYQSVIKREDIWVDVSAVYACL